MELSIKAGDSVMKLGIPSTNLGQALRPRKKMRSANRFARLRMAVMSLFVLLAFVGSARMWATTYYVSSSTGNDSNNGTAAATAWQTIAHVNGQTFQPGDSILFRRGDVWNESLVPPSSGSSGSPIAFDGYGTGPAPNLTGYYAVPANAWVLVTGNAWKAPVPSTYTAINFCLFGSVWGQKVGAVSSNLTARGDFYLANGFVYVYSSGNPATFYNEAIVPMALSNVPVINVNGQSWLTFQHFLLNWFDQYGVYVQGASDHLVFANMEADSMIPQGTQPLGFYVNESTPGPGDLKLYNAEAHLNYDGFRFDGAATAITMVNDKAYANRDGALVDNTSAVTYSHCHFYASSLAVAGSTDVEFTSGTGPIAGAGNIAADTPPAVLVYQRYPAEITLTVDDSGMTPGADTYYANSVLPVADAAGVPVGAAITVGYGATINPIISEIQGWINAGRDVTSHSMSHTYYTNTDALDIQYTGNGTAAVLSISGKVLTITVTGASDSLSYNLAQGQAEGTIKLLRQALLSTGKFTATEIQTCQGPYGTGCSAYTEAALLGQDLADVSGQDVKSSVYHLQLDVTRLTTDEIALSRQWMTTNLTGLPTTPVYVYPGGYETTAMQGITQGVPYQGARGALKEDLGVKDTYADGFNVQNITSFGVNPSWMGLPPASLNQKIQALVWKQSVWGVPWGIFWHLNELTNIDPVGGTEITNLIQDFKNSGATIRTNTGLVNWLLGGTQVTGTDGNDYYTFPAMSAFSSGGGLDFRPTKNSPVVGAGQNLGAAYELDINGVNQNSYGSGWEIGAHVYQGYAVYGSSQGGSHFKVGMGASLCGPPLYLCSSISTAVAQTPNVAPFSGTTGYNQVGYDTSINPSGIDPIVRVTDSTMLGGHSPSSTFSGGDNDLGFSCTGTSNSTACQSATLYYYTASYGGSAFFEGLELVNGIPQVVAPFPASGTPSFIPNGAPAFSSTNPALAYEEIGSNGAGGVPTIKQIALSWSGTVGQSPTLSVSQLYSLAASCAPLPNGYGYGQTYSGLLSHDVTDNIFGIDLSNVRGFGTGIYLATVANGSTSVTFTTTTIGQAVAHAGAAGTGYVLGDIITPTQSGSNGAGQLVVTSVGAGGVVTGLAVYTPGKNYSTATGLATTGGTGTGLQVDITIGMLADGSYTNAAIKLNGVVYTIASNTLSGLTLTSGFSGTACATSCSMSVASGQGTGQQIVFVQLSPAACQVINTYNGTSQATGAWAGTGNGNLTGPCPKMYVHEGNIQGNGIWGTYSNGGSGCGNSLVLFQVGTLNSIPCTAESTVNPVPASLCFGHLNVGYKSFSIIGNPNFFNVLPQNVGSSTPVAPFGSVPPSALGGGAANCENHFSWRNATAAETQMTIGGTANNNYSTSASTSTWGYPGMNENYGLDASGVMHRFGHNFVLGPGNGAGCGTTNAGPFDYYFNGQFGIGTVSPDGRLWVFSSSMLGQLGTDVTGNLRQDNFMIALQ